MAKKRNPKAKPAKAAQQQQASPQNTSGISDELKRISDEVKAMTHDQVAASIAAMRGQRELREKQDVVVQGFWQAYRELERRLSRVLGHEVKAITFNEDEGGSITISFYEF